MRVACTWLLHAINPVQAVSAHNCSGDIVSLLWIVAVSYALPGLS